MFPLIFISLALLCGVGLYYMFLASAILLPVLLVGVPVAWGFYTIIRMAHTLDDRIVDLGDNEDWIPFNSYHAPPSILIIEDDLDAATAAQVAFADLGCSTKVAISLEQAKAMLSENSTDFIILDWLLQNNTEAGQVLDELSQNSLIKNKGHRPKVVTYSSLKSEEIDFPHSEDFEHIEHWQKPIRYADFRGRSMQLLATSGY